MCITNFQIIIDQSNLNIILIAIYQINHDKTEIPTLVFFWEIQKLRDIKRVEVPGSDIAQKSVFYNTFIYMEASFLSKIKILK